MAKAHFYKRRTTVVASLFILFGLGLSVMLLADATSGVTLQALSWGFIGAGISMTIADAVHLGGVRAAHNEVFCLALAGLLIEVVLVIALAVLVLAFAYIVLSEVLFDSWF